MAGCGSSGTTTPIYHPLRPPAPRSPPAAARRSGQAAARRPRVGATQRTSASGTTLSVTVHAVLDPLRGSGAALLPGTRAVGVVAEIQNDGPGDYDSSATGDFSIVPSSGTATPVFAPRGPCATPLRDWDNEISPGELRSGCVAFALTAHAQLIAIRFSPHARAHGRATWFVRH
jgi:hypothetical protein